MPASTVKQMCDPGRGDCEIDERWVSIDAYTMSNLHPPTRPSHASLSRTLQVFTDKGLPNIMNSSPQGKFFSLQCRMLAVEQALEVGILGDYSAIWLATENPGLYVTTLNLTLTMPMSLARTSKSLALVSESRSFLGVGMDVLPQLYEAGKRERVGFTFVDADEVDYWNYVDWAIKMSLPRACVVVDNVVAKGELTNADSTNSMGLGGRKVVERGGQDERG